jgi:hypothetical protein
LIDVKYQYACSSVVIARKPGFSNLADAAIQNLKNWPESQSWIASSLRFSQ